jgi:L-alanine-DL-glutamate epimerase-like enolase superfamily enzyme
VYFVVTRPPPKEIAVKITDVRILPLAKEVPAGGWASMPGDNIYTLVEIVTDEGVTGLGSVYTSALLVEGALALLRPMLIDELAIEPARVSEKLHQSTFWQGRGSSVTHTVSGIDIALWDIFGKATGQPVSRLLGGRYRETIRPYASISMSRPDWTDRLPEVLDRGFKAVKLGWGRFGRESARTDEDLVKTARDFLGPEIELMVDAGGSGRYWPHGYKWALETARMLHRYDVVWFEEPLRPDDLEGYIRLTENALLHISSCEVFTRRQSFLPWIESGAVDIVQPDVTKVGGLTEGLRIATCAYDRSILTVPHGWNTAVGMVADLHLMAAVPTARWVEYYVPTPFIEDLVAEPFRLDDEGMLQIPDGPGLAAKWNPDGIRRLSGMDLTPSN